MVKFIKRFNCPEILDKQKQILATALRLFVTYGFHGTPTSKIAEEAAIANGTLFHYYKTKDELVLALYNDIKNELAISLSSITYESDFVMPKFRSVFIHTIKWALHNKDKFYYLQQFYLSPHRNKIQAETVRQQDILLTSLIAEGVRKKLLKQLAPELMFTLFNSQVFGIYQYLVSIRLTSEEQERIIDQAYEMTWELFKYN